MTILTFDIPRMGKRSIRSNGCLCAALLLLGLTGWFTPSAEAQYAQPYSPPDSGGYTGDTYSDMVRDNPAISGQRPPAPPAGDRLAANPYRSEQRSTPRPAIAPADYSRYEAQKDSWRQPLPPIEGIYGQRAQVNGVSMRPTLFSPDEAVEQFNVQRQDDEQGILGDISPTSIKTGMLNMIGQGPNEEVAKAFYEEGMRAYQQKDYVAASKIFGKAAFRSPKETPIHEESLYMQGESSFFCDNYREAHKAYVELIDRFDHSRHRDVVLRRMFKIADYWNHLDQRQGMFAKVHPISKRQPWIGTFSNAMNTYEKIWTHDALGPLADDSLMASGRARMQRRHYDDAIVDFGLLRRECPDSEHVVDAYVHEIDCLKASYQGSHYDGTSLANADKLIDQATIQFGTELGEDRQRLLESKARIRDELALREWKMGQYYDKKEYYGAARMYYETIPRDYPKTPSAQMASARYEEIRDEPAEPHSQVRAIAQMLGINSDTTRR